MADGATVEQVQEVATGAVSDLTDVLDQKQVELTDHLDSSDDLIRQQLSGIDNVLSVRFQNLDDSVAALSAQVEGTAPDDTLTYTVRIEQSQVQTAKQAVSLLCTELLVLIVVLCVGVGLLGWAAFTKRWL